MSKPAPSQALSSRPANDEDHASTLRRRYLALAYAARRYYRWIDDLWSAQHDPTHLLHNEIPELEAALAGWGLEFLAAREAYYAAANQAPGYFVPTAFERSIEKFRATMESQFRRWGWDFLLEPGAGDELVKRFAAHKDREVLFLSATRAWRSMDDVGPHLIHFYADSVSDEAKRRKIPPLPLEPGTTAQEATDRASDLHRIWRTTPALAEARPAVEEHERRALGDHSGVLGRGERDDASECPAGEGHPPTEPCPHVTTTAADVPGSGSDEMPGGPPNVDGDSPGGIADETMRGPEGPALDVAIKSTTIPPEFRTIPLGMSQAAKYMGIQGGNPVKALRRMIDVGKVPCERLNRKNHVFDIRHFPDIVHDKIRPKC